MYRTGQQGFGLTGRVANQETGDLIALPSIRPFFPTVPSVPFLSIRERKFTRYLRRAVPVHRIRLIGPWDFTWNKSTAVGLEIRPTETCGSVKMPCEWQMLFGNVEGSATFSRRFHRPTNLESHEQVVIVLTGVGGEGTITLNSELVADFPSTIGPVEVDVTRRLQAFNVLEVCVCFRPSSDEPNRGGLFEPVVLEIRAV